MSPSISRHVGLCLLPLAACGAVRAQSIDAPPTTPAGVSASLYPNAGGELFWQRSSDDRGVRGYEITRNGTSLGIVDALSLYDPDLRPDVPYTFTVAAVDTAGQRSAVAGASLNGGAGGGPIAPPSPADLSARVYSGTSGELFWARASVPGLDYEVVRDGTLVGTTDGTSYYDDALAPGRDYRYSVVAVDGAGGRSEARTAALRTPGDGAAGPDASPPPGAPDLTPLYPENGGTPAPRNITLAVYSDTTAELNWTRPNYGDGISANEILRDGTLIDTIPGGGNSYLDDSREAGRGYRYEIVAINRFGRASSVFIDTGSVRGGPVGGEPVDGADLPPALARALDTTFDLLNGTPFEKVAATVRRLEDPVALGLELITTEPYAFSEGFETLTYRCPLGGTWTLTEFGNETDSRDVRADACRIGPIELTGRGQTRTESLGADGPRRRFVLLGGLSLSDERDGSSVRAAYFYAGFDDGTDTGFLRGDELDVEGPAGRYRAETFRLGATAGEPPSITLSGESVTGALAGAARLRSREPLLVGDGGRPASGAVAIVQLGTNAQAYDIAAGNGNPDTFTFTATADGVTTAYELAWSATRTIGGLSPESIDVGF